MSKCSCETLEKTRRELKAAQKRIAEREADLLALGRRCAALAETLKVQVKRTAGRDGGSNDVR